MAFYYFQHFVIIDYSIHFSYLWKSSYKSFCFWWTWSRTISVEMH